MSAEAPLVVNGWTIYAHPLFLDQLDVLVAEVYALKQKDHVGYVKKNAAKRLAGISKLAFEVIPEEPSKSEYRQGDTLGNEHKHWFRVKFFQQYRLFFRYHAKARIIVYAWINDKETKRAYNSTNDAYRVFRNMLAIGHPPSDWDNLLAEAKAGKVRKDSSSPTSLPLTNTGD